MRPVALGRKYWIHIGSPQAGPKVAAILSVVESCRRLKLPVRGYLAAVLPGLADLQVQRLQALTPTAWVASPSIRRLKRPGCWRERDLSSVTSCFALRPGHHRASRYDLAHLQEKLIRVKWNRARLLEAQFPPSETHTPRGEWK